VTRVTQYYRQVFAYLGEIRPFAYFTVVVFLMSAMIGVLYPGATTTLLATFREFAQTLRGQGAEGLILAIFIKNASTTAMAILLGAIFGVLPFFSAVGNGLLLGGIALQHPEHLWRVIPHGLFELPAVFIAWGAGVWIGMWLFHRRPVAVLVERLRKGMQVFVAVVIPLLVIAAIIEGLSAVYVYR
jgi:stage II sporulation protein M